MKPTLISALVTSLSLAFSVHASCPPNNPDCEPKAAPMQTKKDIQVRAHPEPMWSPHSNLPALATLLPANNYPVFAVGTVSAAVFHLSQAQAKSGAPSVLHLASIRQLYLLTPERVVRLDPRQYSQSANLLPTAKAGEAMPLRAVRVTQRMRNAAPKLNVNFDKENGQWLYPLTVVGRDWVYPPTVVNPVQGYATSFAWQPGAFALPVVFSDPGPDGNAIQMLVDQFQDPQGDPSEDCCPTLGANPPAQLKPISLHAALEQLRVLYFKGAAPAAFAASQTGEANPHRAITNEWLRISK